jgi:putative cell wall-binding protein
MGRQIKNFLMSILILSLVFPLLPGAAGKAYADDVVDAVAPVIVTQPKDMYADGRFGFGYSFTLEVGASAGGELSYQWYQNDVNSNSGGTLLVGKTGYRLTIPLTEDRVGTVSYYYCVVTNTDSGATGNQTATTVSRAAEVIFTSFINAPSKISESAGLATIYANYTVRGRTLTLRYGFGSGTATANNDFGVTRTRQGTVAASGYIYMDIVDDAVYEGDETMLLTVQAVEAGYPVETYAFTIVDNDAPTLSFDSDSYSVSEDGTSADITVTRSGDSNIPVAVDYATSDGTATAGSDYTAASGTLTFEAGVTSQSFTVPILDDSIYEGDKTVSLALSNATGWGATLGRLAATLTITDNEPAPPAIGAQPANVTRNIGETAVFTVSATATGGGSLTYQWQRSTDDGSSWSDIAEDAIDASYTTPVLVYADNNTQYKCVVTNTKNATTATTTSNAAILTVNPATITAASVTGIAAPAAGAAPIAAGSLTAGDTSYTVTGLTWQNSDGTPATLTVGGKFKAGSTYQAVIELTSASENKFQAGGFAPTVNAGTAGAGVVSGGDVSGNKLTFTVTFAATEVPPPTPVVFQSAAANGASGMTTSTKIDLVFDTAITGLSAGDITITSGTGSATKGALTGSDTNWSIAISGVSEGTVSVAVSSPAGYDVSGSPKTVNVYAKWTYSDGGSGGGGSGAPSTPTYNADVKAGSGNETALPVTVDKDNRIASTDVGSQKLTSGETVIMMPSIPDADTYSVGIPVPDLSTSDAQGTLTLHTDNGSVTVPSNMLTGVSNISGSKAEITIGQGNKSALPEDVKAAIGDKPLIRLTLSIDGKQTDWSNRNAPVTVSIPYTPTAAELANPESIVIWYIDGSGKAASVPNGRYDPARGNVTFFTTHFSGYAVAYGHKTFSDLGGAEWARKAIEVMASKGITGGTGNDTFSPSVNITRADYMVQLINTLGLTADFTENFDDVKPDAYYYNAVGVAKKLGIAAGSGNNRFNPTMSISRQDMMVPAARALEKYQGLKAAENNTVLDKFSDKRDIAEYAVNSLATLVKAGLIEDSGNKLNPRSSAIRAEVAVFLYNIYNKYPKAPVITASTLSRLAGQSRIDTALSVAKAACPDKMTNAVLATADNYPDALAGSILAYQLKAPILLVGSSEADQEKVIDYLKVNLEQKGTVYILGGTAVVGSGIEARIQNSGFNHIVRIAGDTRYNTSVKIAEQLNVKPGAPVVLVSGENYPDALAVSSIAAQNQFPILLVQKDGISDAVSQELANLKPGKVYIIGLEGAIIPAVENQAAKITGLAAENIVRIGGADRYATSLAIAEYFNLGSQTLCIATGNNFPDALAGSVYAAKTKAPIILTDSRLPEQTADYVESRKPAETVIFGGEAVVSKDIEHILGKLAEVQN